MDIEIGTVIAVSSAITSLVGMAITGSRVISRTETAVAVLGEQHRQIKESIDSLTAKVGEQNGRVGKVEQALAARDAADRVRERMEAKR